MLVNELWADIYGYDIDELQVYRMHSGKHFIGFLAGDADKYIIGEDSHGDVMFLGVKGNETTRSTFTLNGRVTSDLLDEQGDDWQNFEAKGGLSFVTSIENFYTIADLIGQCAGDEIKLVDMSNY